jgi:ribonuclease HI
MPCYSQSIIKGLHCHAHKYSVHPRSPSSYRPPPPPFFFLSSIVTLVFLWSVWIQRSFYCKGLSAEKVDRAVKKIVDHTLENLPGIGSGDKRPNITRADVASFSRNPPADSAIVCFTDGSVLDNPGPSGAGVYFTTPIPIFDQNDLRFSIALGHGSNNWGEMVGLYLALRLVEACLEVNSSLDIRELPIFIFSDSLCCICYITDTWPPLTTSFPELHEASTIGFERALVSLGCTGSRGILTPKETTLPMISRLRLPLM